MPNLRLSRFLLTPFEFIYRCGFFWVTAWKSLWGNKSGYSFVIVSVGNLSVGGTGKSVVVPFLTDLLGAEQCAIVLRGYKGACERRSIATLVSDGVHIFADRVNAGDEAMMYATNLRSPVIVSKNRARACDFIQQLLPRVSYVILDDGYQNFAVKKNIEILLLDARSPFDNGHCLPVGRLRERDVTRAHIIIVTHADCVSDESRAALKKKLLKMHATDKIFYGAHRAAGVFWRNKALVSLDELVSKKFLLAAGVGSFSGVVHTAQRAGVVIEAQVPFSDHYEYRKSDIDELLFVMRTTKLDGIVVTSKDWVKIDPLLESSDNNESFFYVLRVGFEFLLRHEYDDFSDALKGYSNRS